jgi:AraC-like DNA-binding protein
VQRWRAGSPTWWASRRCPYLTGWRLTLAADLLREPDATLVAVARQVGYSSPFALSAAFKRERGISPQEHRTRASDLSGTAA